VHTPTAIDEFQPSLSHQSTDGGFGVLVLVLPPATEEGLLAVDELTGGVGQEGGDRGGEDVLDTRLLERVVQTEVVLLELRRQQRGRGQRRCGSVEERPRVEWRCKSGGVKLS
jgi:hypothetical protein